MTETIPTSAVPVSVPASGMPVSVPASGMPVSVPARGVPVAAGRATWRRTELAVGLACALVLPAWAFRLATVEALAVWPAWTDTTAWAVGGTARALAKGLLWDVALALGVAQSIRACGMARPGPAVGMSIAMPGGMHAGLRAGLCVAAVFGVVVAVTVWALALGARGLVLAHAVDVGAPLSADAWAWLAPGGAGDFGGLVRSFDPQALPRLPRLLAAAAVAGAAVALVATWDIARIWARAPQRIAAGPVMWTWLIGVPLAALALRDHVAFPPAPHDLRGSPEWGVAHTWRAFQRAEAARARTPLPWVEPESWRRLAAAGIVPPEHHPSDPWPVWRRGLAEPAIAHAKVPGALDQPDVVLVLVESWNRAFLDGTATSWHGLMPELGAVLPHVTRIEGLRNTASPTLPGLIATLCGVHAPEHPGDVTTAPALAHSVRYDCLPSVLAARGYRTAFVQGANVALYDTNTLLKSHGFQDVEGEAEVLRWRPTASRGAMGLHDGAVLERALALLDENATRKDRRPIFLVVMTLDTHYPGMAPATCSLPRRPDGTPAVEGVPADVASQQALAAYHCSDRHLARLARHLLAPERASRTLWLMTGDHISFRTPANAPVFAGRDAGWSFGPMPLLLHDPRHQLPRRVEVHGGSHDLAPTLLHLLGLDDAPSTMAGHSLFGSRPHLPLLVGRIGQRLISTHDGVDGLDATPDELALRCRNGQSPLGWRAAPVTSCDLAAYIDWMDALWRQHRLRPPERPALRQR